MNRRKFLKRIGLVGTGAVVAPMALVSSEVCVTEAIVSLTPTMPASLVELAEQTQLINRLITHMDYIIGLQAAKNQPLDTLLEGFENMQSSGSWATTSGVE